MRRLETASNLAILAVCGLLVFQILEPRVRARPTPLVASVGEPSRSAGNSYAPGEMIGDVPGINFQDADRSLILVVRSTCKFCTLSMPFYARLAALQGQGTAAQVAAVSTESVETSQAYFRAHGVALPNILTLGGKPLKVTGTPTLLLVDRTGAVQRVWRGKLSPAGEKEVLALAMGVSDN